MEMATPTLVPLFRMTLAIGGSREIGPTLAGRRRIVQVTGGRFAGPRMQGEVLAGEDWITERADGAAAIDVRLPLLTTDGHGILMRYRGVRHGPAEVMARLARGERVDPRDYYFRIAPTFEPAAGPYEWLARLVAIGTGTRLPDSVVYDILAVE